MDRCRVGQVGAGVVPSFDRLSLVTRMSVEISGADLSVCCPPDVAALIWATNFHNQRIGFNVSMTIRAGGSR